MKLDYIDYFYFGKDVGYELALRDINDAKIQQKEKSDETKRCK